MRRSSLPFRTQVVRATSVALLGLFLIVLAVVLSACGSSAQTTHPASPATVQPDGTSVARS